MDRPVRICIDRKLSREFRSARKMPHVLYVVISECNGGMAEGGKSSGGSRIELCRKKALQFAMSSVEAVFFTLAP
jgi:hypothetical protein